MKRRVKALTVVLAICLITVFIRCQSNETPIQQLVVVVNGDSIEMVCERRYIYDGMYR